MKTKERDILTYLKLLFYIIRLRTVPENDLNPTTCPARSKKFKRPQIGLIKKVKDSDLLLKPKLIVIDVFRGTR